MIVSCEEPRGIYLDIPIFLRRTREPRLSVGCFGTGRYCKRGLVSIIFKFLIFDRFVVLAIIVFNLLDDWLVLMRQSLP